jgi:hypothetical protein
VTFGTQIEDVEIAAANTALFRMGADTFGSRETKEIVQRG